MCKFSVDLFCLQSTFLVYFVCTMEWSNENVLEFLDLYENEVIIWNAGHIDHKNRNLIYDAWKRIESKMGGKYSVAELKKKKESLMASFRACQNKVKESTKSGAGIEEIYKPNWFAYEKMISFLKNNNRPRNTINSEVSNYIAIFYFQ